VAVGPCPNCGGSGQIPDGFYEFTGDALNIFSTWPADRLRQLAAALESAQAAANQQAAIEALQNESDLEALVRRLSPLRDASAFWGFIAVVLSIVNMMTESTNDPNITINERTVIEHVIQAAPRSAPTATPTLHQGAEKTPPPSPKRKKPKGRRRSAGAPRARRGRLRSSGRLTRSRDARALR
jgi:hypothetical protein